MRNISKKQLGLIVGLLVAICLLVFLLVGMLFEASDSGDDESKQTSSTEAFLVDELSKDGVYITESEIKRYGEKACGYLAEARFIEQVPAALSIDYQDKDYLTGSNWDFDYSDHNLLIGAVMAAYCPQYDYLLN